MFTLFFENFNFILLSFCTSTVLTLIIERTCRRIGLMDWPGTRKMHQFPVPRMGGLAFFLTSFLFGAALSLRLPWELTAGAVIVFVGGFFDDVAIINTVLGKLFFQIPGALLFSCAVDLSYFHLGSLELVGIRFLVFAFLFFLTNAANLMDNMNGLTAGISLVITASLSTLTLLTLQNLPLALIEILVSSSLLGFAVRNFPSGKIYMGDQGSQFLGFFSSAISVLTIIELMKNKVGFAPWVPSVGIGLLFLIFFCDVFTVVWIRLSERRSPFVGDQCHLSHQLVRRGLTPVQAVIALVSVQALLAFLALTLLIS
jgi:UDP-GlcNAc:undecaprenyl-phosphate/decaprenyl-phosphate GlcNAc-1-phosphate transferase